MPPLTEVKLSKLNILGYGQPMAGKTRFIATILRSLRKQLGREPRCYIFNFDSRDNLLPVAKCPDVAGWVEFDQYNTPDTTGYDSLVRKIVALKKQCDYDLVCVENGGQMHRAIFDYIMKINGRTDADGARIQDWGLAGERLKVRLKEILELPAMTYVTFHQQIEKEEIYGRAVGRLLVPGKSLPDEIPPMFNLFLHFVITTRSGGEPDYWVQCAGDNLWPAGDKTGSLSFREEPDFERMWEKINKQAKGAKP
jgi:hypothetical protein